MFLTTDQLSLLTGILDCLIPGTSELPAAGQAGVAEPLANVMGTTEQGRRDVTAILHAVEHEAGVMVGTPRAASSFAKLEDSQRAVVLSRVEANLPKQFGALVDRAYLEYYTDGAVLEVLHGRPWAPQPHGRSLPGFDEAVLDAQKKRTPFWRETDSMRRDRGALA